MIKVKVSPVFLATILEDGIVSNVGERLTVKSGISSAENLVGIEFRFHDDIIILYFDDGVLQVNEVSPTVHEERPKKKEPEDGDELPW